jgi:tRNA G18 (ribose-2'-O)-methylase SpoU
LRLEKIHDFDDPRVADYRDIKDATLRDAHGLFVVESRLCVERLIAESRFTVRSVFVTEAALESLRDVLTKLVADTPVYVADRTLLKRVVGYDLHRGCIAAAERGPVSSLDEILGAQPRLLVGLERVGNPENVGNVFRNAVAFGADAVLLSSGCADPLYRKAVRVSMGGTLRTPFAVIPSWPQAITRLRSEGFLTAALSTDTRAIDLAELGRNTQSGQKTVLVLGAEGQGLAPETLEAAEYVVRIPMSPTVDSLNVATAAGVALYHCFCRTHLG